MTRAQWTAAAKELDSIRAAVRRLSDVVGTPGSLWPREFRSNLYWAGQQLEKAQLAAGKAALKEVA